MCEKVELFKQNNGLKIKIYQNENDYKVYFINEKGMYIFLNEETFNDCFNGIKTFLINSIIFNGYEAIKEIKFYLKNKIFKNQEDINVIKDYMFKIKI